MTHLPILFSINYSQPAVDLHQSGLLGFDRFKCPDWPELVYEVASKTAVAVHFNLITGTRCLTTHQWEEIDQLAALTNTPFISVHLSAMQSDFPEVPLDNPSQVESLQIHRKILADVLTLVDRLGAQRIIVENVPYTASAEKTIRTCVEPDIISQVVRDADCGLLLDLAHARISAHYLGLPVWEYILKLPLERLRELHIAGVQLVNGVLNDHLALTKEDWSLLERVLNCIHHGDWPQPWMAAFEYGGLGEVFAWRNQPEVIASQAPRIYNIVKGLDPL